jgi:hypothetical protein
MRRYDIVFGIILILSIIDFALAAPVLVQEKRQAYADVVHTPKGARTALRKRVGEDDLVKLVGEFLKSWRKSIESSDTHASSSSVPPVPDRGSTSVMQGSASNPASSTGNTMEPPSLPWAASMPGDRFKEPSGYEYSSQGDHWHNPLDPLSIPGSPGHGSDNKWTWAKAPKPKPMPSTVPDPDFDWNYWTNVESPPRQKPAPPKEIGLAPEYQYPRPSSTESDFDWNYWTNVESPPRQPPESDFDWNRWMDLEDSPAPAPRPAMPKAGSSNPSLSTELDNVNPPSPPPKIYSHSDPGSSPLSYSPPTRIYSYSDPGSGVGSPEPLPYTSSPTKFYNSHELVSVPYSPSSGAGSPTKFYNSYPPVPRSVMYESSPDAELRKVPEDGMAVGLPPNPVLINPNLQLDRQPESSSTGSQHVNLQDVA